jgi:hypothetical protein
LALSEEKWSQFVEKSCPMGTVGGIPPWLTRACISEAYEQRIQQVQTCSERSADERRACLDNFKIFQDHAAQ